MTNPCVVCKATKTVGPHFPHPKSKAWRSGHKEPTGIVLPWQYPAVQQAEQ